MSANETVIDHLLQFEFFQKISTAIGSQIGVSHIWVWYMVALILVAAVITGILAAVGGFGTYAERKISADIQGRFGPNRVGPYGLFQVIADGLKMIGKEDISPNESDKFLFYLAPFLCIFGVVATFAVLPFSAGLTLSKTNVGIYYVVAISSLVGLGIFIAGYASNSKWSLLGGMRGASQIISYEIPVTLSIMSILLLSGGLSFEDILANQTAWPAGWYIFHNPFTFIGFFVYFVSVLAETNRAPFDLPEAESELVSGYHTEYTGMRYGLFALAEYMEVFVVCGLAATLFLGGYHVPFDIGKGTIFGDILQIGTFFAKTLGLYYVVIWVRWTFPRLRVDHLMSICWKYLTPIALFNLLGVSVWILFFDGKSILDLFLSAISSGPVGH
ncbi:MAG: NADH-quinone oxidoreductase subunit NuoH [Bacteriovoracaceae bacterium]|nr:NADH-quinone oxidoreductase subunit NuoH [Bacteriovoracaceae bacterium]